MSAQAVRNYEDAGILPTAERSASGYRRYTPLHAQALRSFVALRAGHGHQQATQIMYAVNRGDIESAYQLIGATHAALLTERDTRTEVARGLDALSRKETATVRGPPLSVGELGGRLGTHSATLRTWEAHGILHPARNRATAHREYGPDCVRDAEIARQLRRGGYQLTQVAQFLDSLHQAGGTRAMNTFLAAWQDRLTKRSRDLLAGAAKLDTYLTVLEEQQG